VSTSSELSSVLPWRKLKGRFKFNKETEFTPILGLVAEQLNSSEPKRTGTPFSGRSSPVKEENHLLDQESRHHPLLLAVLADELGCSIGDIQDFEL
jgi:aspartyl aminopeptidase